MVYQNTNGKSKDEFEVYDIKPAVEFAADLMESWDLTEAERSVHAKTGVVVGGDAGDEGMVASGATFIDQPTHQKVTDSFMAGFGSEIDSGLKGLWYASRSFQRWA